MDLLHRFDQLLLLHELNRTVKDSGCILFPHVHLANNQPIPYFDRGGHQLHGKVYDQIFKTLFNNNLKTGYIFSEPKLFEENDIKKSAKIPLISTPNTKDYNGLIAILPQSWQNITLSAFNSRDINHIDSCFVLINLLLDINFSQQTVTINHDLVEKQVGYLLDRHPIYLNHIKSLNGLKLSDTAIKSLYLAKKGLNIEEISIKLNLPKPILIQELQQLEDKGLLQILPISRDAIRLQYYLMSQQCSLKPKEMSFRAFWERTTKMFPDNLALISLQDESEFTYADCDEIIQSIGLKLNESGFKKGDRILICSKMHTEPIVLLWACLNLGITVVPVNADLPLKQLEYIIAETKPKLLFFGQSVYPKIPIQQRAENHIIFDEENEQYDQLYFSDWVEQVGIDTILHAQKITSDTEAVILYTSGSTGTPKGVKLSHGHLIRSGKLISNTFHWNTEDRFYSLGTLNTMSGLRNSSISALHTGSSVIIPKESTLSNVLTICTSINENKASILGSNPTFLRQLVDYHSKIKGQLHTLKTIICTGNLLSNTLRKEFEQCYKQPIYNYYGLTETTGICLAQHKNDDIKLVNTIGKPIDCIVQLVDEQNQIVDHGEEGELRIFSENIMLGYLNNSSKTNEVIKNGWFYTNDLAKFINKDHIELVGRKKTIIKTRSEELIYLSEIRNHISEIQHVKDIYLHPHRKNDVEQIIAFIIIDTPELDYDTVLSTIKTSITDHLGKHKIPNTFITLKEFPYNFDGKLAVQNLLSKINVL